MYVVDPLGPVEAVVEVLLGTLSLPDQAGGIHSKFSFSPV